MDKEDKMNPWLKMWVAPKQTIRAIVQDNPNRGLVWLSWFYGFLESLHIAQLLSFGETTPLWMILLVCIVVAIPLGFIFINLSSVFIFWVGKLIRGRASYNEVRSSVVWSNVTTLASFLITAILLGFFGADLLVGDFVNLPHTTWQQAIIIASILAEAVLSIWRLVIFIKSLAEVQKFSGWMGLLNVILAIILALAVSYVLGLLLTLIPGGSQLANLY